MTDSQWALVQRAMKQFGQLWIERGSAFAFRQADDGTDLLLVDHGNVMFNLSGENLHVTGPVPGGKVMCAVYAPDGTFRGIAAQDNPFSPEQAALN